MVAPGRLPLPHMDTAQGNAGRGMRTQEDIRGKPLRGRHHQQQQLLLPLAPLPQTAGMPRREVVDTQGADSTAGASHDSPVEVVAGLLLHCLPLRLAASDMEQMLESDRPQVQLLVQRPEGQHLPPAPRLRRSQLPQA